MCRWTQNNARKAFGSRGHHGPPPLVLSDDDREKRKVHRSTLEREALARERRRRELDRDSHLIQD